MALVDRLRGGLARTREVLTMPLEDVVRGRRVLDEEALEAVEEALLGADMGLPAVEEALEVLKARSSEIASGGLPAMRAVLRQQIREALERPDTAPSFSSSSPRPWVVFVVGVNGAGKTTTIGKLASAWRLDGHSVLVCAADTFRAAAAEQLETWADRARAEFHRGAEGADPSAVLTDALRAAKSRGLDVVLVDTAGRLHTRSNLMAELAKMARVAGRESPVAPHETLLVLDATVGGNGLAQGREFARAGGVTGLVLAKLDGTARGGVAVAVVRELGVPIRFVGVGEKVEDLVPFDAEAFATSLVGEE